MANVSDRLEGLLFWLMLEPQLREVIDARSDSIELETVLMLMLFLRRLVSHCLSVLKGFDFIQVRLVHEFMSGIAVEPRVCVVSKREVLVAAKLVAGEA